MEVILFVLVTVLAIYGAHLFWEFAVRIVRGKQGVAVLLVATLAFAFVALTIPGAPAAAQSLDIDLTPFFDSMNTYLPIFLGVFGVIGGIGAAIMFARFVINAIQSAISGRGV